MSKQRINTGTTPSDGTGDNVRAAFDKVNANFDEVYESLEGVATAEDIGNAVANEAAARATAITAEATARAAAISGEASARSAGDATNASAIAAEATARAAAVSTEVANRLAGDATNASAIAAETSARIAADALKADLVGGVIPTAQIPAIAISTYLGNAANQAAMLAFTGQSGDWCNRSDTSTAWVITGADPTQLSSWAQINYPASPVTSVNGQSGVIVLGKADVGLGSVDNTADSAKPVSTAQQTALNLKQDKSSLGADLAAAVHATTNKPTLVDLDEFNINDSAATYTPKKTTFASLKASIRSYLATVFANVIHADNHKAAGADSIRIDEFAVPTDNTNLNATTGRHGLLPKLGGGTTNFLRADGSWAAPPGGGGGGSMVFSSGVLQGYTDPGSPDSPGVGFIYADAWTPTDYGTITFEGSGDSVTYSVAPSDPEDGTTWIDALSCVTGSDLVTAIYNDLTANHLTLLINTYSGATLGVQDGYSSGSASYVNVAWQHQISHLRQEVEVTTWSRLARCRIPLSSSVMRVKKSLQCALDGLQTGLFW